MRGAGHAKGLAVDTWKFYDITHREHVVCNPTSEDKLARLAGYRHNIEE